MEREYEDDNIENCPFASVNKIVSGKWTMVIVFFLSQGTLRFGQLSRKMPQVTQANLTKELRMLEDYGLIHREVYKEVPPKVEYSLTELGVKFLPVLEAIEKWAIEYKNQKTYRLMCLYYFCGEEQLMKENSLCMYSV